MYVYVKKNFKLSKFSFSIDCIIINQIRKCYLSKAKQFVMYLESIVFRIMIAINLQTMDSSLKLTATIDKDAQSRKTHRTLRGIGYTWRPLHGNQRHDKDLPRC